MTDQTNDTEQTTQDTRAAPAPSTTYNPAWGGGLDTDQAAALDAAAACGPEALMAMGWKPKDDAPAKSSGATPAAPAPTSTEARIKALNDPKNEKGIYAEDAAAQKAEVNELRVLLMAATPEAELQKIAETPVQELRAAFNVHPEAEIPKHPVESWNTTAEQKMLSTMMGYGVPPDFVRAAVSAYTAEFTRAMGDVANLDFDGLVAKITVLGQKHGIATDVIDAIVDCERTRLYGQAR
jgi:hypothetical protein